MIYQIELLPNSFHVPKYNIIQLQLLLLFLLFIYIIHNSHKQTKKKQKVNPFLLLLYAVLLNQHHYFLVEITFIQIVNKQQQICLHAFRNIFFNNF